MSRKNALILLPRQLFDPLVATESQERRQALEDLVGLNDHHHRHHAPLPPEGAHKAEGHDDDPCGDDVHVHGELGVAAATDNAEADRHLIAHAHHHHAHNDHQVVCQLIGGRGEIIEGQQGLAQQEQNHRQHHADGHTQYAEGAPIGAHTLEIASADSRTDHDGAGGAHRLDDHLQILIKGGSHAVGGDGIHRVGGEMSQNRRLHGHRHRPQQLAQHHRGIHLHEVPQQSRISLQEILREQAQLLIELHKVHHHDAQLHNACNQRTDRRTANAHLGEAKAAENQRVVDGHIDNEADGGGDEGDPHRTHTSQGRHKDAIENKHGEGVFQQRKIRHTRGNNGLIGGKEPQQLTGDEAAQRHHENAQPKAEFQRDTRQTANGADAVLSPILGSKGNKTVADTQRQLLHHEKDLIDGGSAGKCRLAIAAQHDVVRHVDAVGHQILQGDSDENGKQRPIKGFIFCKEGFSCVHWLAPPFTTGMIISRKT